MNTLVSRLHAVIAVLAIDALAAVASLICTSVAGFDRTAFHETFNAGVVAFLGSLRR